MKKLWLVSALSLGLILLAWCNPTATQAPVEIDSSDDMISMYNEWNAMTCNLTYNSADEQWTSIMYIKDGMISQETESTIDGENVTMYTLARDGKMYVWWNVYGEGVWMSATYEIDIEEELQWFDEVDENTKVSCAKGVEDDSVFNLPTNIEFTSMDEWLNYAGDEEISLELDEENWEIAEDNWEIVVPEVEGEVVAEEE